LCCLFNIVPTRFASIVGTVYYTNTQKHTLIVSKRIKLGICFYFVWGRQQKKMKLRNISKIFPFWNHGLHFGLIFLSGMIFLCNFASVYKSNFERRILSIIYNYLKYRWAKQSGNVPQRHKIMLIHYSDHRHIIYFYRNNNCFL